MEQHIIAALQKCGVHRKHGHRPLFGHPSRHRGRAALGDPHIKKAFGIGLRKGGQPGPPHHGGRQGTDTPVVPGQADQRAAKHPGKVLSPRFSGRARLRIEGGHAVKCVRVTLRRCKAFPLYSFDMEQDRLLQACRVPKRLGQFRQIVSIHRSQVGESHILEHTARQEALLQRLFYAMGHPVNLPAQPSGSHKPPVPLLEAEVLGLQALLRQMPGHRAHVPVNGHSVVIQDNQQLLSALPAVRQPLIGQAAGEGPVSDEGGHLIILAQGGPCLDHPYCHCH